MTSIQDRLKLKRAPTDIWSIREQLCLASSVLMSGDQNWMSVSRSLKHSADSTRSADWFSQKSCAQQYAYLLENEDIPRRKKRESGETTSESIVRRLTQDRISELSKTLASQKDEFYQLKNEINLLKNPAVSDEKLQKMWFIIEVEEKEKSNINISSLNKHQQNKEVEFLQTINQENVLKQDSDGPLKSQELIKVNIEDLESKNNSEKSSVLTSLLKLPHSTTQLHISPYLEDSSSIENICSNLKVPRSEIVQNVALQFHELGPNNVLNTLENRTTVSVPTLSMLLEKPSVVAQKTMQEMENPCNMQIQSRPSQFIQNNSTLTQVQVISSTDLSSTDIPQLIPNSIDKVMDKDEINEIIGDIEELIKEEITASPETLQHSKKIDNDINDLNVQNNTNIVIKRTDLRNVDEPISLSNSPTSEISIEEIDSSTSNIAEIIGTAIGTVGTKLNSCNTLQKIEVQKKELVLSDYEKEKIQDSKFKSEDCENFLQDSKRIEDNKVSIINYSTDNLDSKEDEIIMTDIKVCSSKGTVTKIVNQQEYDKNKVKDQLALDIPTVHCLNSSSGKVDDFLNLEAQDSHLHIQFEDGKQPNSTLQERKTENNFAKKINCFQLSLISTKDNNSFNNIIDIKGTECVNKYETVKQELNRKEKEIIENFKEVVELPNLKVAEVKTECTKKVTNESDILVNDKKYDKVSTEECSSMEFNSNVKIKQEKVEDVLVSKDIKEIEDLKNHDNKNIKIEQKMDEYNEDKQKELLKKVPIETVGNGELEDEEPSLSKLSGGRVMKTYSKKQNATVDSEPENDTAGETADYRAWKKSILLVYNRLATHKYASVFLRPITEDQAPGYHSIIFRPMDLSTIKRNVDNGTVRSTTHFQRDVMLMFQNAIMFNKHNTFVHKMTLEMQEECLQHMQVLVRAAGEASFRRETRTAASISNETTESSIKRKWNLTTCSPHETENSRMKKRRKSEND